MLKKLLELLHKHVQYSLNNSDIKSAFQVYNRIVQWLKDNEIEKKDSSAHDQISNYLIQLKFISLNFFDDNEILDLLKYNFPIIFKLPGLDLWDKLKVALVSISDIDERAHLKEQMKIALEKSDAYLLSVERYKDEEIIYKVSEWLKDFLIYINNDLSNSIKQAEYMSKNSLLKKLNVEDRAKVLTLIDLYKKLSIPSNTKEGYENASIIEIDGQKYIYDHGQVEKIPKLDLSDFGIKEESPMEDRLIEKVSSKSEAVNDVLKEEDINDKKIRLQNNKKEDEGKKNLEELQKILNEYPLSSLEYKAVKQEINRLQSQKKYDK